MYKHSRANHQPQSRSLLYDHKNKLALPPPSLKPNTLKPKVTRANSRPHLSPSITSRATSLNSQHPSPLPVFSQPVELTINPFSKSEEETKAQQEDRSQSSPCKETGWTGVLAEYKDEIMDYVLQREIEYKIDGGYLHHSHILSAKMRIYLVRHMFKIYNRFDLLRTTLHLAVHYLDLYFSKQLVLNDQLEGIAAAQACLFIAMKYEEIYPPDLKDWVDRRHRQDVLKMEAKILATLNFQLAHYTIEHYVKMSMWEKGEDIDDDGSNMELMVDLTLFDMGIRQMQGSHVAAVIRSLVRHDDPADHNLALSVKWMVERHSESLYWLRQQKYGESHNLGLF